LDTGLFLISGSCPLRGLEITKRLGAELLALATPNILPMVPNCALCGKRCPPETCKVTYQGEPVHNECIVAKLTGKPLRPWHEIARELAKETNRNRVAELRKELNQALAEHKYDSH
jgi:hypothetical protein